MDRRQKKSREAIFKAFFKLLEEKDAKKITVGEIIKEADVGRATFYAHFETKDFLLKEMCEDLFCHLFDKLKHRTDHNHMFSCDFNDKIYLHLLKHLKNNDNHILDLITDDSVFSVYFEKELSLLARTTENNTSLPNDLFIMLTVNSFMTVLKWWRKNEFKAEPEEIHNYFMRCIEK